MTFLFPLPLIIDPKEGSVKPKNQVDFGFGLALVKLLVQAYNMVAFGCTLTLLLFGPRSARVEQKQHHISKSADAT